MKLTSAFAQPGEYTFEVHGAVEQQHATLVGDSSIFNILSRLYSRPIEAVIRETATNAFDAHIEAGTEARPFEVSLPTSLKSEFTVRDFGPGLSKEDVFGVFTVFGYSTKKKAVKAVGWFGLGAKAHFAVTDTASITSWHGGKRMTFAFTKDQEDKPIMILLEEIDSLEPTGLRISYPVPDASRWKYVSAAETVFARWPEPRPRFLGYESHCWPTVKYVRQKPDHYGLRDHRTANTYRPHGPYALMGGVAYSIDSTMVPAMAQLQSANIDLFFELGELKPSPSRESLEYTPAVIAAITRKMDGVLDDLRQQVDKLWKDVTSMRDAIARRKQSEAMFDSLPVDLRKKTLDSYTFKGLKIPENENSFQIDFGLARSAPNRVVSKGRVENLPRPKLRRSEEYYFRAASQGDSYVVSYAQLYTIGFIGQNTDPTNVHNRMTTVRDQLESNILLITGSPDQWVIDVLKIYGFMKDDTDFIDFSLIPNPVVRRDQKRTKTKLRVLDHNGYHNSMFWKETEIDASAGGVYVELDNLGWRFGGVEYRISTQKGVPNPISQIFKDMKRDGLVLPDTLYGVSKSIRSSLNRHKGKWVELTEYLRKQLIAKGLEFVEAEAKEHEALSDDVFVTKLPPAFLIEMSVDHKLRVLLDEARSFMTNRNPNGPAMLCWAKRLGSDIAQKPLKNTVSERLKPFAARYPMLFWMLTLLSQRTIGDNHDDLYVTLLNYLNSSRRKPSNVSQNPENELV